MSKHRPSKSDNVAPDEQHRRPEEEGAEEHPPAEGTDEREKTVSASATTEFVVDMIVERLKEMAHKLIPRDAAREVYRDIIAHAIKETYKKGYFKLPYGYGQFYLTMTGTGSKPRRLPDGSLMPREPRPVIRYLAGQTVRAMMGTQSPSMRRKSKRGRDEEARKSKPPTVE